MSEPTSKNITQEIEKVATLISTARRLLSEDKMIDLSALEGKVRELCADVRLLPPDEMEPALAAITDILQNLGKLAQELKTQHESTVKGLQGADPQIAANAYTKKTDKH